MKRPSYRCIALILAGLIALGVLVLFSYELVYRNLLPTRSEIESITPNASKKQVTTLLGAFYDESKPGEYPDVDRVLNERSIRSKDTRVLTYGMSDSNGTAWIICGEGGRVIDVWIED